MSSATTDENIKLADEVHRTALVINALDSTRIREVEADDQYIEKLRSSGTTAIHLCVAAGSADEYLHDFKTTLWYVSSWWRVFSKYPDVIIADSAADVKKAKDENKIAVFFGIQNVTPLDGNLALLPVLKKVGITMFQLTYQRRNIAADGCGERHDTGLSNWGLELVEHLNKLGMIVDLSHCGAQTTLEAIEHSSHPVVISHACARSLSDTVRNHTDEEIRALAAKGGVIGIAGKSKFLKQNWVAERATIDDYVDHIEYVRDLVGIDHVGIGTDIGDERKYSADRLRVLYAKTPEIYDNSVVFDDEFVKRLHPIGLGSPGDLGNITRALVTRGFTESEIRKVLGENFLRIFSEVLT